MKMTQRPSQWPECMHLAVWLVTGWQEARAEGAATIAAAASAFGTANSHSRRHWQVTMGPTSCTRTVALAALVADEEDEQLDHRDHEQAEVRDEGHVVARTGIQFRTSKIFSQDEPQDRTCLWYLDMISSGVKRTSQRPSAHSLQF